MDFALTIAAWIWAIAAILIPMYIFSRAYFAFVPVPVNYIIHEKLKLYEGLSNAKIIIVLSSFIFSLLLTRTLGRLILTYNNWFDISFGLLFFIALQSASVGIIEWKLPHGLLKTIHNYFSKDCIFYPSQKKSFVKKNENKDIHWKKNKTSQLLLLKDRNKAFNNISVLEFEKLIHKLYNALGYKTEFVKKSYHGGFSITAEKNDISQKEVLLIQCKKRNQRKVGVGEIFKLLGIVDDRKATKGALVCSTDFTPKAIKKAQDNPSIELINSKELIVLLNKTFGKDWAYRVHEIINDPEP